ncbi:hypothetical protein B0A54_06891 [Friedmanniomyces endolithicus]|uniref:SET domain-containing protein n=1 Tax=Friedmanniomyces endolithicus TaxID=329885 RepID=A0A4U0V1G9_9PEZI|nr:hypothetical protein B0A54_06891 [Friedmanniomyces endolithicus]
MGSTREEARNRIPLERSVPLYMLHNTPKGRAVHAAAPIPSGTTTDTCPVLILSRQENTAHIEKTSLYHYTYNWPLPNTGKTQAVVFGLGSMFNHSSQRQNVGWMRDLEREVVVYKALRDIGQDEELCISYGDHLTFEDADAPLEGGYGEGEEESGESVLDRIQLDDETLPS